MKSIKYNNKSMNFKDFYTHSGIPRLPDEKLDNRNDYNYMVAIKLKLLGYSVIQELPMPEWGIIDIFAYKGSEIIIAECKSEKDRNMMRALGQILTYTLQLNEYGYKVKQSIIITRTEPAIQRIKKDVVVLSQFLPSQFRIIRFSNKTPNLML